MNGHVVFYLTAVQSVTWLVVNYVTLKILGENQLFMTYETHYKHIHNTPQNMQNTTIMESLNV